MVDFSLESLTFSDGTVVNIADEGVTLLVGPNNSGKSQTLRDIKGLARSSSEYQGLALSGIQSSMRTDDFDSWVDRALPKISRSGGVFRGVPGWAEVSTEQVRMQLNSSMHNNVLIDLFVLLADGQSRLSAGNSQPSIDTSVQFAQHPVQICYYDKRLEDAISDAAERAFFTKIVCDRFAGSNVTLRLGRDRPVLNSDDGRPNEEYLQTLKALPKLEDQGDGVRSYIGLLLHIVAGKHDVLLVDEPEAFLHPPQARSLGREIADKSRGKQALIATHSSDFLQGVISSSSATTIVRITRSTIDDPANHPAVLDASAVEKLWSDPLLRHSNILDGLFHDAVVLCEADTDCRYYSAIVDALVKSETNAGNFPRVPDLLFTHCGGKDRMPMVVEALAGARVPVVVIADFDILRVRAKLVRLLQSLGQDFDSIETDWNTVTSHLNEKGAVLSKEVVRSSLLTSLDSFESDTIGRGEARQLQAQLKTNDGWTRAKESGLASLGGGNPALAGSALLGALADVGVLVVPVGELERFDTRAGGHGTSWVSTVFERGYHDSPTPDAKAFAELILTTARAFDS